MARNNKRNRIHSKPTIPLGIVAGLMPVTGDAISGFTVGMKTGGISAGIRSMGNMVTKSLTGWDQVSGTWDVENLKYGLLPLTLGIMAHRVVGGMLGVNRMLARAGVPLVRI